MSDQRNVGNGDNYRSQAWTHGKRMWFELKVNRGFTKWSQGSRIGVEEGEGE